MINLSNNIQIVLKAVDVYRPTWKVGDSETVIAILVDLMGTFAGICLYFCPDLKYSSSSLSIHVTLSFVISLLRILELFKVPNVTLIRPARRQE